MNQKPAAAAAPPVTSRGLTARAVSVTVNDAALVQDVDCDALAGSVLAVVGPNGAGKSSLLAALARLHGTGVVELDGTNLDGLTRRARARSVAMVQQSTAADVQLTVRDAVALGRTPHLGAWGDDAEGDVVTSALRAVGMADFSDRTVSSLSGGERQRMALGMALAQQPRLLIVDEPSNHLDVSAQLSMMSLLRDLSREGPVVIVALHDLALALEFSDSVLVLKESRRVASGPTSTTLTSELIGDVYGVEARILTDDVSGRRAISYAPLREQPDSPRHIRHAKPLQYLD